MPPDDKAAPANNRNDGGASASPPPPPAAAAKPAAPPPPPPSAKAGKGAAASPPAATSPPAAPAASANLLDDNADSGAGAGAAADQGAGKDWRAELAGDNKDVLKILERYQSPAAAGAALLNLRSQLAEGKKAFLPADATPEQVAEFRQINGIPEKFEGYHEALGEGLVVGESDKVMVDKFMERAHALNARPEVVNAAVETLLEAQVAQAEAVSEANDRARHDGIETLTAEWKNDYRGNKQAVSNFLSQLPEEAQALIHDARDKDGVLLLNRAPFLKALCQIALEMDPHARVVPNDGKNPIESVEARLAEIRDVQRKTPEAYWKNEKLQNEERELIDARDRIKKRSAA